MKDSLPTGWVTVSLGDICVERVSQALPTGDSVPYIDISAIDRATKRIGETKLVTADDAPTRARQWVRAQDVLVSLTRPNLNAVAQVHQDLDGAVASTGFDVLRPVGVLPEWVFYRVRSSEFVSDVCEDLQGVVYPAIRPHDVRRHRLPLPPEGEQLRIVEAIESYFTRLDDAVATLERVQRNLKRYRASVLKAAVEGRLVPTEAELARAQSRDYEPASVLLEHILAERRRRWEEAELTKMKVKGKAPEDDKWKAKYKEPVALDVSRLPDLPEGWCWATVGQVGEAVTGTTPPTKDARYYGGDTPFFKPTDLDAGYNVTEARQFLSRLGTERARLLPEGSLLVTCIGATIGKTGLARVPCATNQQINALVPESSLRASRFLFWYFSSTVGQDHVIGNASSTTLPILNKRRFEVLPVPLPPVAEQARIVSEIERQLSVESVLADSTRTGQMRLNRLRQSILKWAFDGRLVDQDPTDEPASQLLERIQAERESKPTLLSRARRHRAPAAKDRP